LEDVNEFDLLALTLRSVKTCTNTLIW